MKTDALVLGSTMSSGPGAMQSSTWPPEAQASATPYQGHQNAPGSRRPHTAPGTPARRVALAGGQGMQDARPPCVHRRRPRKLAREPGCAGSLRSVATQGLCFGMHGGARKRGTAGARTATQPSSPTLASQGPYHRATGSEPGPGRRPHQSRDPCRCLAGQGGAGARRPSPARRRSPAGHGSR